MTMLGEVVLKFGATGEAGEPSLRFKTGHINLLVGPNNAGKSLMLREISGVNPREERHTYYRVQYPPTRIVASVDWSEEVAQSIKQNIVEAAFEAEEQVRAEIERQPWDSLVPKLDQAIKQLTNVRDELSSKVFELLKNNSDELVRLINLIPIDKKDGGRLLIAGAVFVLTLARAAVGSSTEKGADTMPAGQQEGSKSLLSPEQTAALENVLEANWRDCCEIFASLGVDMAGLTIKDLCGAKSIAIWLKKASKIPLTGPILLQDPKIAQLPEPDVETIRRFDRFMILGGWLLDTTPLERLLKGLEDVYARLTWADPEHRADIAKDVLYLDGLARLEMTRSVPLRGFDEHDQDAPPILSLLKKPDVMRRLRTMVASALGRHLVIDMVTEAPKVIWRLADKEPDEGLENRYSKAANEYHSRGALLEERSDGIHAFIGMLAAILAKGSDVVFIDEPEAFLHPPLVRKLARQLVSIAKELNVQFFVATHSADLAESFASAGADVNIIRLTYSSDHPTARLLDSASLRQLALDPLLRAESTLSALFHDGAVVCEAAADRVLYREVNERLLLSGDEHGVESCTFLNAQNWQTVPRIIEPLRKMGVAAAAILDADVLFGRELGAVLDAAQVPKIRRNSCLEQRTKLKEQIVKRLQPGDGKLQLKGDVIAKLKKSEATVFKEICNDMAAYGVFLVPVGELEDWLSYLGLKRSTEKLNWLRTALDRMGIEPEAEGYVRPGENDIWQFMREVNRWIRDPDRKGTSLTPHQDE